MDRRPHISILHVLADQNFALHSLGVVNLWIWVAILKG